MNCIVTRDQGYIIVSCKIKVHVSVRTYMYCSTHFITTYARSHILLLDAILSPNTDSFMIIKIRPQQYLQMIFSFHRLVQYQPVSDVFREKKCYVHYVRITQYVGIQFIDVFTLHFCFVLRVSLQLCWAKEQYINCHALLSRNVNRAKKENERCM